MEADQAALLAALQAERFGPASDLYHERWGGGDMEQEALIPVRVNSLYAWLVENGDRINHGAWLHALHEGSFVGECACGDYLVPLPTYRPTKTRTDYEARCRSKTCGAVICAPGGRLAGSSNRKRIGQP